MVAYLVKYLLHNHGYLNLDAPKLCTAAHISISNTGRAETKRSLELTG